MYIINKHITIYLIVPSSGLNKPPAADVQLAALFNPTWLKSRKKEKRKKEIQSERKTDEKMCKSAVHYH